MIFIGMGNYPSFCAHLSDACEFLRQLRKNYMVWKQSETQEQAPERVKKIISKAPVLQHNRSSVQLELQCDASEGGLEASVMQSQQLIVFAVEPGRHRKGISSGRKRATGCAFWNGTTPSIHCLGTR